MRSLFWLVVASLLLLPGCGSSGAPAWLSGDWIFDSEASSKAMGGSAPVDPSSLFNTNSSPSAPAKDNSLMSGLSSMMGQMLLPQLEGMEVRITGHEIMTLIHGNGTTETYQVVSASDQECLIKTADGKLATYYRSGNAIYLYPDGNAQFKIFFKRKS